jgi:cardiolipin synthase C
MNLRTPSDVRASYSFPGPGNYSPLGKGGRCGDCDTLSGMKRTLPWLAALGAFALGCSSARPPEAKPMTVAAEDTDATRLAHAVLPAVAAHPGLAGIHALPDPRSAFAARALLADAAERTIDAQYYIWHSDETGTLLFEALWRAAGRGIRVRLLVDDNNTSGLDETLAVLDAHPKIEVRLYNALVRRRVRALNYVTDFRRLDHRMHNKSFTVDNQATIVGGRNVGNEYFGAGHGVVFADLDVLAVGPVVRDVSGAFDRFWNSASATPAAHLLRPAAEGAGRGLEAHFSAVRKSATAAQYVDALHRTALVTELLEGRLALDWAEARLVCDDPAKTLDRQHRGDLLLLPKMLELAGRPARELDLVSPYFVPGAQGTAVFQELARSGVRVRVLTNSLSATDVTAVHAGYAKRRVPLLQSGVRLFELERTDTGERGGGGGSSSASLHAKTFAVDRERLFVGSFNFDPRSAELNTEMGLVIRSPALAGRLAESFDTHVPSRAYEVRLSADGKLSWIERKPEGEERYDTEPETGFFRRAGVGLLSILPIEQEL